MFGITPQINCRSSILSLAVVEELEALGRDGCLSRQVLGGQWERSAVSMQLEGV